MLTDDRDNKKTQPLDDENDEYDEVIAKFEKCGVQLKEFANSLKSYPSIIDKYRSYYENQSKQNALRLNQINAKVKENQHLSINEIEKLESQFKQDEKFARFLKATRYLKHEILSKNKKI